MKSKLFNQDCSPSCSLCARCRKSPTEGEMLCIVMGVVPEDFAIVTSSVTGIQPDKNSPASKAFDRICLRLNGERVPLFED